MADTQSLGHDPFGDDSLLSDVAELTKDTKPVDKAALKPADMKRVQEEGGFDRSVFPAEPKQEREPLKAIQFRLPGSEIDAFHAAAYEEFGNKHGAKTDLFRKMWKAYLESRNS